MSGIDLCVVRSRNFAGEVIVRLGVVLLDDYLEFLAGRCRANTVLATAYDLKVFFTVVGKPVTQVSSADVFAFMTVQGTGGPLGSLHMVTNTAAAAGAGVVSARTLRRRLSSVSGLFSYLHARGDVAGNPVPRGLPTRRELPCVNPDVRPQLVDLV
jgi:site-specific recombinase XerC